MYGTCSVCGCTDNNACIIPGEENCHWVNDDHDLCSNCVTAFLSVNGKLIGTLHSKQDWINKVPYILPKLPKEELLLFVDVNGNILRLGKDFSVAEEVDAFPVKIYHLIRCESAYKVGEIVKPMLNVGSTIKGPAPEFIKQFRISLYDDCIVIDHPSNRKDAFDIPLPKGTFLNIGYDRKEGLIGGVCIESKEKSANYYECCGVLILFGIEPPSYAEIIEKLKIN